MNTLVNINLNQNELQNAVVQNLATAPASPKVGQIYYNTGSKIMFQYNGTSWVPVGGENVTYTIATTASSTNGQLKLVGSDGSVITVKLLGAGATQVTSDASGNITITSTDTTYNDATTTTHGLMSASDKVKLNGIQAGAQVNQNAFSNVVVAGSTLAAETATDTLTITAGSNIVLTPNATNDSFSIAAVIPAEYVTQAEMEAYAQPIGNYATVDQLNSGLATKLNLSGGTMTGAINMGSFAINNLPAATSNQQPATFKQLNDAIAGLGTVFDLKGTVATYADLPITGNVVGDVWYVEEESVGYIWLQDTTGTLRWEKFGQEIDLSGYLTKAGLLPSTGSATDNTMTQAAITAALNDKADITDIPAAVLGATATMPTTATTQTVTVTGYILTVSVYDSVTKAEVLCDVTYPNATATSRPTAVITVASSPTNALNIVVTYVATT